MIDPDVVLSSVIEAFLSIPEVVNEMGGPGAAENNIVGHYFAFGAENSLVRSIGLMTSPSILVAYLDLLPGAANSPEGGMVMWKHRLECYLRPANGAGGLILDTTGQPPATIQHLWWLMMNKPCLQTSQSIRYLELANGDLTLMDTPTLVHRTDELGADIFIGNMVFPEKGDMEG